MKIIISLIVLNILLVFYVFYKVNIEGDDVKVSYLADLSNLTLDEGFGKLSNYEVSVSYIESDLEKDMIVYTSPKANSLVYDNQMITLYVSKGFNSVRYKNLENLMYDDVEEYINDLKQTYNLSVLITYKEDNYLLDGLIYSQKIKDEFVDSNDVLELTIIKNDKTIVLPSFVSWHYKDVIVFANENNIRIMFEYMEIPYEADYVIGQSVASGTLILKNSNPIVIYLAK